VLTSRRRHFGFSLIEMMIAVVIAALLLMIGLPNMNIWLNNTRVRTAGETLLAGLNLARTEAVRRNTTVRFQLVSDLTSACALSTSGTSWVVSLADPAGACDADPSDVNPPQIIQKKSGAEGTSGVVFAASGGATVRFNGLGRVTSPGGVLNTTSIEISNPAAGACQHVDAVNGTMRCLRIRISTGGEVKMCDPAVVDATDPRICPP
jgi:type IV fimbrial biogenesis protein FimT